MRASRMVGIFAVGIGLAGTITASGCLFVYYEDDCEQAHDCPTGGTGGMSSSSSSGSSSTGTGGMPINCIPSASKEPVADSCGVFVSSSLGVDDKAVDRGTKEKPFKTLGAALLKANAVSVYACAESFTETVTISSTVSVFGALDCTKSWAYEAKQKTTLTAAPDAIPLTLTSAATAQVEDFAIVAANAATSGSSSIAVLADQAKGSLVRCDLIAGDGKTGTDGDDAPTTAAQAGTNGNPGNGACSADTVNGGALVKNACGMANSIGGKGGDGNDVIGTPGAPGLPGNGAGQAGVGDDGSVGWSCVLNNGNGGGGAPAAPGKEGAGALMSESGTLTSNGFVGAAGKDGDAGKPGQGGGGGGGVKGDGTMAKTLCNGKPGVGGASGGSGGSGGCGGAGGKGGKGGGSSIALVSLRASLTLSDVTLKANNGGKGGAGGDLQAGGQPGNGGPGGTNSGVATLSFGCDGGKGGQGGDGGAGGGGRGGHSIGLAYTGTAPAIDAKQIMTGTAGKGGPGGNSDLKMNSGSDGAAAPMQVFP